MFGTQGRTKPRASGKTKLHSIAAVLRERSFEGGFELAGVSYSFSYRATSAAVKAGKLLLTGILTIIQRRPNARGAPNNLRNLQATLVATQGGIGAAPPRNKLPPDIAPARADLPVVESTGALSFCGALYFKFAPIDGRVLRVPADMGSVQLNARLAPRNDLEREFQSLYSSVADALYGKERDANAVDAAVSELNNLLSAG